MVIFMEYRKNDIVTLKIEDCGIDGEGIGKADGFTVFVKDAVIGDTVRAKIMKAKKNYGYGRLEEIITPSPDRVEPKCQFARQCGGCQLQALSYEKQLEFKTSKVRGHLERIGGFTDIPMEKIRKFILRIPSLDEQNSIVSSLDRFDTLCTDLSSGLPAEIEARQKQYEYYRDKLLTFTPAD